MSRYAAALLVISLVLSLAAVARASLVDGSFTCTFPDEPDPLHPAGYSWSYDYTSSVLTLTTLASDMGADRLAMSATTTSDPAFLVNETVTNNSGVTWTGYRLTLSGDAGVTFTGDASSSKFATAAVSPAEIDFSAPLPVADGESVGLSFNVNIAGTGLFSWSMTQQPTPEPATLALLGIGGAGVVFLRNRRRA
jgi:hypothetical protein